MKREIIIKLQATEGSVAEFLRHLANEIESMESDDYCEIEDFETADGCVISVEEE